MSRILLVDDSPHAQRIGERILTEEGYEVVTVSNADSALIRLDDAEPDVVIAKAVMPGRSGYEICRFVKMNPRHKHVRVILTSGAMESLDEAEVIRSGADGTLRKPFEATALLDKIRPLAEASAHERAVASGGTAATTMASTPPRPPEPRLTAPVIAVIDPEQVKAAVTVALDASMASMVDEITTRVLAALTGKRHAEKIETHAIEAPLVPSPAMPHPAPIPPAPAEPVRPVVRAHSGFVASPSRPVLRPRTGSILGLNLDEPETPPPSSGQTETE